VNDPIPMKKPSPDPARITDAARLLPILGAFLLMPPLVTLFAVSADLGGVPLIVVYLFGVWLALIVCAAWLARRLAPSARERDAADGT
jgi:hypothetical protein